MAVQAELGMIDLQIFDNVSGERWALELATTAQLQCQLMSSALGWVCARKTGVTILLTY